MNQQQKQGVIVDIRRMFDCAEAVFLINYKGLSVSSLQLLRKNLRENNGAFKVVKASLMRLAAKDISGTVSFADEFKNQVGLVFANGDVSATAKELVSFAKNNKLFTIVAGFYESGMLAQQDVIYLASLPSREILIAQLLGTMQAPISTVARLFNMLIARIVHVLKRIEENK